MARERVPTGISGLDKMLQGGLPQGKSYLISGPPGTGKTTFAAQFIQEGLKRGENGIFISIDEKPSHMVEDIESLGWDLRTPADEGRLTLLDVSPYFNWVRYSKTNAVDANEVLQDLSKQVRRINAKRVVIDPLVPLVLHRDRMHDVQEYIRKLIFGIDDNLGVTTLMTTHPGPWSFNNGENGIEEFMVSGVITVRLAKLEDGRHARTMFVRKMRGTPTDLMEYTYSIETNRGIVIGDPLFEAQRAAAHSVQQSPFTPSAANGPATDGTFAHSAPAPMPTSY
jgi:circadian clock protein KaiC